MNRIKIRIYITGQISFLILLCVSTTSACESLTVSGAIVQKGIEGEYQLHSRCSDIGNSWMFIQTHPAAGWGSVFYIYYYDTTEEWKGWMFSIYPCSDIPFVRSTSRAASPDLVDRAWEEYVTDSFQPNPDIVVKCKDDLKLTTVMILLGMCILSMVVIVVVPVIIVKKCHRNNSSEEDEYNSETDSDSSTSQTYDGDSDGTVSVYTPYPQLPDYTEVASSNTQQHVDPPPNYSDIMQVNNNHVTATPTSTAAPQSRFTNHAAMGGASVAQSHYREATAHTSETPPPAYTVMPVNISNEQNNNNTSNRGTMHVISHTVPDVALQRVGTENNNSNIENYNSMMQYRGIGQYQFGFG